MFISDKEVWKVVARISRAARGRRFVATPYLTAGAVRRLGLKNGDVVLCDLSLRNCKSGSTDPREVQRLQRKGVLVYQSENLHAKVFVLGRRAIVGSMNVTKRSQAVLDEAAVVVRSVPEVQAIRAWFAGRLHSLVQSEWLQECLKAYRPPRGVAGTRSGVSRRKPAERARGVLIASLVPRVDTEKEEQVLDAAEKVARRRLAHPRLSTTENIRWHGGREFRRGDEVIQVLRDGDDVWVYPHARVVHVRKLTGTNSRGAQFVFLELPRSYRRLRFKDFQQKCKAFGFVPKARRTRSVTDPVLVHQMLTVTSPEKLRRG